MCFIYNEISDKHSNLMYDLRIFLNRGTEMQTVMWNKRRIIIIIVISIFAYFLLRKKQYAYNEEFVLKNVRAETVWEFLADFSNNKKHLIPHM